MQRHNDCAMWVSVMLLLCIGLVAAHVSRSYKFKNDLFRQQYLNDAVKQMEMEAPKPVPCVLPHCQDI